MTKPVSAQSLPRLDVAYRAVGELIPDPRNARTHPKRQIDQIKASIKAFGFTNPILTDPEGRIIAGHGRLDAARAMGIAEVPTITLFGLSEIQKRALRIADNKIALNAGWDLEILQQELGGLASVDVDIDPTLTGFSTGEIDVILSPAADPDDEVIPPTPATPRTRPGDIWILGDHRVGCGDGRDVGFLQRIIGDGARIDAAFLDPSYNARIAGHGHAAAAGSHREFAMASGERSEAEFRAFLADTLGAAAHVSRDGAVHFVCMDWRHMDSVSAVGSKIYGEQLDLCIWSKSNASMGSLYRSKHELVFVYRVGTAPHLNRVVPGKRGRPCCRLALPGFDERAEPLRCFKWKLGSFFKVADRSCLARCSELIYFRVGFFKRTPSPPPFSSMNSMPAFSSARFNLTLVSSVT